MRSIMLTNTPLPWEKPPVKLLGQLRQHIRYKRFSIRTEDAYVYCVRYFIRFHCLRHPLEMGAPEVVCIQGQSNFQYSGSE